MNNEFKITFNVVYNTLNNYFFSKVFPRKPQNYINTEYIIDSCNKYIKVYIKL